jgi:uncharacterized protein (TIGR03067 family)
MIARLVGVLAALLICTSTAYVEERSGKREKDARKDLLQLQGTWQLESFANSQPGKIDIKKRTLFIGGDLVLLRDGDKIIQGGLLRVNPTKSPSTIDVVVRQGEHKDNTMLGVYELKGDTLKVCFDPEGESRPKKFETKKDTAVILATYKRVKRAGEEIDIRGQYRCETFGLDNKKSTLKATIQKRGDAYQVTWQVSDGVAFIGAGIRQGNTLSVAWVNRGSAGISVYKIEEGPKLVGVYTEVGGPGLVAKEVLTTQKKTNQVEVRLR